MRFRFKNKKLANLYYEGKGAKKFPVAVVTNFVDVMSVIEAASSTLDLRKLKSLHFEQLYGDREGQCSLRLNDQFRLIVVIESLPSGEEVLVVEIVDYH